MKKKKIIIAIDGFSSCGKSTLARDLAKSLDYIFVDSGSMYRAISLYALENKFILKEKIDHILLLKSLNDIELYFKLNPITKSPEIILNGENVESRIRTPQVAEIVSKIAEIEEVRSKLVLEQRKIGMNGGVVMDGRDIGSVVFPHAELKLFITASINIRVERRYKEMLEKGIRISRNNVESNLKKRDLIDSTREKSPLKQTKDAILIDNTRLNREEQLNIALKLAKSLIAM